MNSEGGFAQQERPTSDAPLEFAAQPPPPRAAAAPDPILDPATTEVVLRRAFELAHREPQRDLVFSRSTLAEIAAEVDLPVAALAAALAEQMADGTDDRSLLDRVVGSDRVSVHRNATVAEEQMRERVVRLLEVGHGMRPRVRANGVVVATKRKDLVGKLATTVRDAQGLGQLGKLRRVEVAAVDLDDEPGALVLSADISDRRAAAVAGGTAVSVVGAAAIAGLAIVTSPFALAAAPVAVVAGVVTSRVAHGAAERDVREDLEEAADALVRGDQPDGLISSARKALESLSGLRRRKSLR